MLLETELLQNHSIGDMDCASLRLLWPVSENGARRLPA